MRRLSRAIITGSLAFSLVAAAAAGTAFTVNTVEGIAIASAAADTIDTEPCTGAYDITWATSTGKITGFNAERIPPSTTSDPGLQYCTDMPYALIVVTDASTMSSIDTTIVDPADATKFLPAVVSGKVQDQINLTQLKALIVDNTITGRPTIQWSGTTLNSSGDEGDIVNTDNPANADLVLEKGHQVILIIGPGAADFSLDD